MYKLLNVVNGVNASLIENDKSPSFNFDAFTNLFVLSIKGGVLQDAEIKLQFCLENKWVCWVLLSNQHFLKLGSWDW